MDRNEAIDIVRRYKWQDEDAWEGTWEDEKENPFFEAVIPASEPDAYEQAKLLAKALRLCCVDCVDVAGPYGADHEHNYEGEAVYFVMCDKFTFRNELPDLVRHDSTTTFRPSRNKPSCDP